MRDLDGCKKERKKEQRLLKGINSSNTGTRLVEAGGLHLVPTGLNRSRVPKPHPPHVLLVRPRPQGHTRAPESPELCDLVRSTGKEVISNEQGRRRNAGGKRRL